MKARIGVGRIGVLNPTLRLLGRVATLTALVVVGTLLAPPALADPAEVRLPMKCSRGPSTQYFDAAVTMSAVEQRGATVTVRIDSKPSGTIEHFGLHYIADMTTDYAIPPGATYVENSLRLVKDTGTANVSTTAKAWQDAAGIHLSLPARVKNGSSYLPPSLEFELTIDPRAPAHISVEFAHYEVTANVVLLGNLRTICEPSAPPATIGVTRVEPASPVQAAGR